jgi:hypothetical protein
MQLILFEKESMTDLEGTILTRDLELMLALA